MRRRVRSSVAQLLSCSVCSRSLRRLRSRCLHHLCSRSHVTSVAGFRAMWKTCGRLVHFLWTARHRNFFSTVHAGKRAPACMCTQFRPPLRLISDDDCVEWRAELATAFPFTYRDCCCPSFRRIHCGARLSDRSQSRSERPLARVHRACAGRADGTDAVLWPHADGSRTTAERLADARARRS